MSSRAVRELIGDMKAEGHCILISSHIMSEVSALCDHLVMVADGCAVASGTPDELRAQTGEKDLEDVFVRVLAQAGNRRTPDDVEAAQ